MFHMGQPERRLARAQHDQVCANAAGQVQNGLASLAVLHHGLRSAPLVAGLGNHALQLGLEAGIELLPLLRRGLGGGDIAEVQMRPAVLRKRESKDRGL